MDKNKKTKKFLLKNGDKVWLRVPMNGIIVSVNQKYGYTILIKAEPEYKIQYFGDGDVEKSKS